MKGERERHDQRDASRAAICSARATYSVAASSSPSSSIASIVARSPASSAARRQLRMIDSTERSHATSPSVVTDQPSATSGLSPRPKSWSTHSRTIWRADFFYRPVLRSRHWRVGSRIAPRLKAQRAVALRGATRLRLRSRTPCAPRPRALGPCPDEAHGRPPC